MTRLLRLLPAAALVAFVAPTFAQTAGRLDPTFSGDGVAFGTTADSDARSIAVQNGFVTVAGEFDLECGTGTAAFLARYTADGAPVASFGDAGVVRFSDDCDESSESDAVVALPDGSLLLVSFSDSGGNEVQRVLPTGESTCRTTFGTVFEIARAAVTPEGDVLITGALPGGFSAGVLSRGGARERTPAASTAARGGFVGGIVKIDVNYASGACSLAPEFGRDGIAFLTIPGQLTVRPEDVAVQPDGRIVVTGGASETGADVVPFLARLTPGGAFDPFFGYGGVGYVLSKADENRTGYAVATGPTGDIVVAGASRGDAGPAWYVQRHRYDGLPDPTFSDDSVVLFAPGPGLSGVAEDVALDDANRVVLVGTAEDATGPRWAIARLGADGRPDARFGPNGVSAERPFGLPGALAALALQPGGAPVVTGFLTFPTGDVLWAVARYGGASPVAGEADPGAVRTRLAVAPNPASERTTVTVEQREAGPIRVAAYDALGREVAVVHDGPLGAGTHRLTLPLGGRAPGVYVVRATGAAPVRVVVAR